MAAPALRVSVVVPAFAHERYIEQALRSLAAQDHHPLELVVVDDASPDGTADVVRSVLAESDFRDRFDGRVQLLVNDENEGAHAALDRGLRASTGSFLTILNSDDMFTPDRVSRLVETLLERNAELAMSAVDFMDDESRPLTLGHPDASRLRVHQAAVEHHASVGFASLAGNIALTSGNLLFTRDLYEALAGFAALRYCHDWDFLLRAVRRSEPVFVAEPLYHYRLHGGNSFRKLGHLAERETEAVLGGYFAAVQRGEVDNPLAPSPERWPGVFDHFMHRSGFWHHWHAAANPPEAL